MAVKQTIKCCQKNSKILGMFIHPIFSRCLFFERRYYSVSSFAEEEEIDKTTQNLDKFLFNVQKKLNISLTKEASAVKVNAEKSFNCRSYESEQTLSSAVQRHTSKSNRKFGATKIINNDENFCSFAENTLKELIVKEEPEETYNKLNYLMDIERFPSRTMLRSLAMFFTSVKHFRGLQKVQEVCRYAYPKEFEWVVGYRHYEAELLWRRGNWKESISVFRDVYSEYPHIRRKVTNLLSFRMNDASNEGSLEMCEALLSLVDTCIQLGDYYPASNMWRSCFLSENIHIQMLAEKLTVKYPILAQYISKKFGTIINRAFQTYNIDILQRLVQCVLTLELSSYYGKVMGALLDYQCKIGNLEEAKRTFKYATEFKIILPASSVEKFMNLLREPNSRFSRKHPKIITDKIPPPKSYKLIL